MFTEKEKVCIRIFLAIIALWVVNKLFSHTHPSYLDGLVNEEAVIEGNVDGAAAAAAGTNPPVSNDRSVDNVATPTPSPLPPSPEDLQKQAVEGGSVAGGVAASGQPQQAPTASNSVGEDPRLLAGVDGVNGLDGATDFMKSMSLGALKTVDQIISGFKGLIMGDGEDDVKQVPPPDMVDSETQSDFWDFWKSDDDVTADNIGIE